VKTSSEAAFVCAGHFVRTMEEPMLARRGSQESVDNFADRFAEALLIVLTYDARAALSSSATSFRQSG
jgi:hypothetical protein